MKRNWWVVGFCVIAVLAHVHFSKEKKLAFHELQNRLEEMEKEKLQALQMKEDLQLRIASQNDPAWIEMVLIRELGVVPEGFLKVHFKK
ncbi:MAG: hypothetical protein K1X28_02055 [Parachlamydiales bacterium]|nr:hypothetical protein [Parachlamydiales bacterium]